MSTRGSSQQSGAAGWMGAFKLWLRGFCLQLNAEPQKDFNAESNKCVIWNKNGISRQCPRYVGRNIKHAMNKISSEIRKPQRKRCMETDVPSQGQKKNQSLWRSKGNRDPSFRTNRGGIHRPWWERELRLQPQHRCQIQCEVRNA